MTAEQARRRLASELHAARVRGLDRLRAITGRGLGNRAQEPVLRTAIEAWLAGPDAARLGVAGFTRAAKGGALDIRIRRVG